MHDEINIDWSRIESRYQDEPIFLPSTIQIPLHGKFKTRKLMSCLDPKYRIVVQCQNIVYVLNKHEIVQPKLRNLERLTNGNDHDKNETQSNIVEDLVQVETDEIVLNESTSQPFTSEEINQMIESNQNESLIQTKVEIEPSHSSVRKVECT